MPDQTSSLSRGQTAQNDDEDELLARTCDSGQLVWGGGKDWGRTKRAFGSRGVQGVLLTLALVSVVSLSIGLGIGLVKKERPAQPRDEAPAALTSTSIYGNTSVTSAYSPGNSLPDTLFSKVQRNLKYSLGDRTMTREDVALNYNNFYEFSFSKRLASEAEASAPGLGFSPNAGWKVTFEGLRGGQSLQLDVGTIISNTGPLEERLYRHRCVEAWSMAVPWIGFPLSRLLDLLPPPPEARFIRFESFYNPKHARGQRRSSFKWPYVEALTLEEARNELALIAVGIYKKPLPPQSGAPIRLVVPWKYGFKSIKSIVKVSYTIDKPTTFWSRAGPSEYGFWANVNPEVPHPRWSQATERIIPSGPHVPTQLFNGYGDYVAHLYTNLTGEQLYMK